MSFSKSESRYPASRVRRITDPAEYGATYQGHGPREDMPRPPPTSPAPRTKPAFFTRSDHSHVPTGHAHQVTGHASLSRGHAHLEVETDQKRSDMRDFRKSVSDHTPSSRTHPLSRDDAPSVKHHTHFTCDSAPSVRNHSQSVSGHADPYREQRYSSGGHAHTTAGHAHTTAGHAHTTAGHAHSTGGHAHSTGGHARTTAGHAHTPGGHAHTPGGHAHTTGGHAYTTGGHAHTTGDHAHTTGDHAHLNKEHTVSHIDHTLLYRGRIRSPVYPDDVPKPGKRKQAPPTTTSGPNYTSAKKSPNKYTEQNNKAQVKARNNFTERKSSLPVNAPSGLSKEDKNLRKFLKRLPQYEETEYEQYYDEPRGYAPQRSGSHSSLESDDVFSGDWERPPPQRMRRNSSLATSSKNRSRRGSVMILEAWKKDHKSMLVPVFSRSLSLLLDFSL